MEENGHCLGGSTSGRFHLLCEFRCDPFFDGSSQVKA
jgi:hypothetical protein